jgi:hypothetical protein
MDTYETPFEGIDETQFYRSMWQVADEYDSLKEDVVRGVSKGVLLEQPPHVYQQAALQQMTEDILTYASAFKALRGIRLMLDDSLKLGYNMSRMMLPSSNVGPAGRNLPDLERMVGIRMTTYKGALDLAFAGKSTLQNIVVAGVNSVGSRLLDEELVYPRHHKELMSAGSLAVSLVLVNTDAQAEAAFNAVTRQ